MNHFTFTIPLILLVVATVSDLRKRVVPDWIPLAILAWAAIATFSGLGDVGWHGVVAGALLGFGLGAIVFYLGGLGGGDVKLMAACGACVGPLGLLYLLFWMAVAGGALALIAAARGKQDLAYVPAIAIGFAVYVIDPGWERYFSNF